MSMGGFEQAEWSPCGTRLELDDVLKLDDVLELHLYLIHTREIYLKLSRKFAA